MFDRLLDLDPKKDFKEAFVGVLEDLRGLVIHSDRLFGLSWDDLARDSGLSYVTVRNLGERVTMRPHLQTVLALRAAFMRHEHVYRVRTGSTPAKTASVTLSSRERTTRSQYGDWRFQQERRKADAKRTPKRKPFMPRRQA